MKTIDFFISKIEEARNFVPDESQIALYNDLKARIEEDAEVLNRYMNDTEVNFNQTDRQRIRLYGEIRDKNMEEFLAGTVITEKEFEKNFRFLTANWSDLSNEMKAYYELRDLSRLLEGKAN